MEGITGAPKFGGPSPDASCTLDESANLFIDESTTSESEPLLLRNGFSSASTSGSGKAALFRCCLGNLVKAVVLLHRHWHARWSWLKQTNAPTADYRPLNQLWLFGRRFAITSFAFRVFTCIVLSQSQRQRACEKHCTNSHEPHSCLFHDRVDIHVAFAFQRTRAAPEQLLTWIPSKTPAGREEQFASS